MSEIKPFDERCSPEVKGYLDGFRKGHEHFSKFAENLFDNPWNMMGTDPRETHNYYVHCLVSVYSNKNTKLSNSLLRALSYDDYLTYALCGRSLIEMAATLRYYALNKYKPLFDKGNLSYDDLQTLVKIDDQHLRGGRFDWELFASRSYAKLIENTIEQIKAKKKHKTIERPFGGPEQVNVGTCIDKWANEQPEVQMIYDLFCDLVHPNVGSNFLVASVSEAKLHFAQNKGEMLGHSIFEESFPLLVSTVGKAFGDCLLMLMATSWPENQIRSGN